VTALRQRRPETGVISFLAVVMTMFYRYHLSRS
jgi:hypothetical protein